MSPTLQIGHQHHILTYSYVGDRLACHQHAAKCHQLLYFVNHHNDVTNITVIDHLEKNDFDHKMVTLLKNGNFLLKNGNFLIYR